MLPLATLLLLLLSMPAPAGAQVPGERILIDPATLPPPHASPSVANPPRTIARPVGAVPQVPPGFAAAVFAEGFAHARWLTVADDGTVFLADSRPGRVVALADRDGDGRAEAQAVFATGLDRPHGLAVREGFVYVADLAAVWRYPWIPGSLEAAGPPQAVTPPGALGGRSGHWTRSIAFSADGRTLYVAIGSASNNDQEEAPRATIQAFDFDPASGRASGQRTFADGLRNPVGLAIRPGSDEVWTVVNERDGLGDELPPDYLTRVRPGGFYGWPYAYTGANPDPDYRRPPPAVQAKIAGSIVPDVLFRAHSAPLGLTFYTGTAFPEAYRGDAFVGLRGSWNAAGPRGYAVARVEFGPDGRPSGGYTLFATGFAQDGGGDGAPASVWGRPVGVAVAADGALLVADDVAGVIWRITWVGG